MTDKTPEEQVMEAMGQPTAAPSKVTKESLLAAFKPETDIIEILLPTGDTVKCRAFMRLREWRAFNARAAEWFNATYERARSKGHPLHGLMPDDMQEAIYAYTWAERSIEPKLSHADALEMLCAPKLVEYVVQKIEEGSKTVEAMWRNRALEMAGNALGATSDTETGSLSPANPSTDTPTQN